MRIRAAITRTSCNLWPPQYRIDKVVEISHFDFDVFMIQPQEHYEFIREYCVTACQNDGIPHCLLVLGEGHIDGVLVLGNSLGEAGLAAYIAGARDIVQARLDRVTDFIISQGTQHTASGSWFVYREELAEKFDLTILKGSGLDAMLKKTLERRPEVAAVDMNSGAIETTFRPEFCAALRGSVPEEAPDIRLRDILPLLRDGGLTFFTHEEADTSVLAESLHKLTDSGREDYAALLNARVAEIAPTLEGTEVVLTDVAPEELARFNLALEAFEEAELAMGDMTP